MSKKIVWQQGSSNSNNVSNLAEISQWWSTLNAKEIIWQQRLIPERGDESVIDWDAQRFDEKFAIAMPQIRGITLYWQKPNSNLELDTTPKKLELDTSNQQLYIYPQSQSQLVIRITLPQVIYQTIELQNPQIAKTLIGDHYVILFRDAQQKIEVKLTLDRQNFQKLQEI